MDASGEFDICPPKRQKRPYLHKKVIAKENVERGREHKTASGNIVKAKIFEAQVICKCGKNCCNKIDVCRQKDIYDSYYSGSWTQKTLFLRSWIKKNLASSKIAKHNPIIPLMEKNFNFEYTLTDDTGTSHNVCRFFFMNCLKVTSSRIYTAVKSSLKNPNAFEKRGAVPSVNKTSEEDRKNVIIFINLFPKYESHCSRATSQKKYLHPNLNMIKLYKEYKNSCDLKHQNVVSLNIFRSIFKNSFSLNFKHQCILKSDSTGEEKKEIEEKKEQHMSLVEKTNTEFRQDLELAIEGRKTSVLTFDLQKTLETPSLTTSVAYYKRQLWTYNLCIYDEVEKKGFMYVWNESVASRGGQEIGSCLLFHLKNYIPSSTENIILYSDSCGGQNRNIKVTLLLHHFLLSSKINSIEQKFFVSGHSYNSCDRCFSLIEKEKKLHEVVATPDDWMEIIKTAKKKEPKFLVKKMEAKNFFTSNELEKLIVNRKKDITGEKVNWFSIRKIFHEKNKPFKLIFSNQEKTQVVNLEKRIVSADEFRHSNLDYLYLLGNKITKSKYMDLMQLKSYIPAECRDFYDNLKYEASEDLDFGIASDVSDMEN